MLEYGDKIFYIDLDQLDKVLDLKSDSQDEAPETKTITTTTHPNGEKTHEVVQVFSEKRREMNITRFNIFNNLLDVLLNDFDEDNDVMLGADNELDKASFAVKLAFNTLKINKIIKEK